MKVIKMNEAGNARGGIESIGDICEFSCHFIVVSRCVNTSKAQLFWNLHFIFAATWKMLNFCTESGKSYLYNCVNIKTKIIGACNAGINIYFFLKLYRNLLCTFVYILYIKYIQTINPDFQISLGLFFLKGLISCMFSFPFFPSYLYKIKLI